uniref:Estradiol 17-beta-dehydrogenase 8-like n=1 Tax=Labrus bergylta TaxID=56723 RepID=A0A3Q3FIB3_9LABR
MTAATRLISRLTLVTGGGSGIGRAVCQRLASEGASVVVADISEESANETMVGLQNELRGQGHMAAVVDVSSKESVKKLVTRIQPPSVCVNAAGITQDHFLLNMEEDHFDRVIQVNLKGSFLITQAVAQALVACGAPKGSIITVGSIVGKVRELQRDRLCSPSGIFTAELIGSSLSSAFKVYSLTLIIPRPQSTECSSELDQKGRRISLWSDQQVLHKRQQQSKKHSLSSGAF